MSIDKLKIGVIGAGIIGTSSALALIQSVPNAEVTLISENFTPNTTSDGSGGLIYPYLAGTTSSKKLSEWMLETMQLLQRYFLSPNAEKLGIGLLSVFDLFEDNESHEKSDYNEDFISYRKMSDNELRMFGDKWKSGEFFTTYYAESAKMLPFFLQKFKSMVSYNQTCAQGPTSGAILGKFVPIFVGGSTLLFYTITDRENLPKFYNTGGFSV